MSLRLIYGRAGCGKSQYIYNQIKQNIDKSDKIYIITPEQFSFTAEQKLLSVLETNSVINAEVITFNRMAQRIFTEIGGIENVHLTKARKIYVNIQYSKKTKKQT